MKKIFNKNYLLIFILYAIVIVFCFIKIFYCSVSFQGNVYHCMTSDYWNFGRGILGGQQLYVDLMDHKGPYLYWIYALLAGISNENIWVVAIAETILFSITIASFTFYSYKISKNHWKNCILSVLFTICYFFITRNTILINVETLLTPFYFWMYYIVLTKELPKKIDFFFIGVLLGFFVSIKYSSIVYFTILFLFFTFSYFIKKNKCIHYIKLVFSGILGVVISLVPFVFYFIYEGTFHTYVYLMQTASNTRQDEILPLFSISLCFLSIAIFLFYKKKQCFSIWLSLATLFCSFIGSSLLNQYFAFFICILFLCFFNMNKLNMKHLFVFILILYYCYWSMIQPQMTSNCSSVISNKYGINNANVLYFGEDMGYGVNGEELFVEPYQWLPAKMVSNQDFYNEMYILNKQRIEEQRFTYLVGFSEEYVEQGIPSALLWNDLLPIVEQYYVQIDEENLSKEETLWIIKP